MGELSFVNPVMGERKTFADTAAGHAEAKNLMGDQLRNQLINSPTQVFQPDCRTQQIMDNLYGPAKRSW